MKRKTTEEFIEDAKKIHGNKYDYSNVKYNDAKSEICIICPTHGEFWQTPDKHLRGQGCSKCNKYRNRYDTKEIIKAFRKIHGDKYDYSKVDYLDSKTKVCVVCPTHGDYFITPNKHLQGRGCRCCQYEKVGDLKRKKLNIFIEESRQVHGDKYDYSKVEYINCESDVKIICKKHGVFNQTPTHHLRGQGCPKCGSSKLENDIRNILTENQIVFTEQKHFDWLGQQSLDFYIPSKNIAIECQGIQHFQPIGFFGGEDSFLYRKKLDEQKQELCEQNNIKILYFSNLDIDYPYEVIKDKDILIKEIL